MRKTSLFVVLLLTVVALATGCGKVDGTGDKGYIDGKGVITALPAKERKMPGAVAGDTLDGRHVSLADYRGKVVVLNVWGAWCPPCRAEASTLASAARTLAPKGVTFLGINTRDSSRDQGLAFERRYGVGYPSIFDPSGQSLLAFRGTLLPSSIPSTVILDKQGRVAASILGEVTSKQTLIDLAEQAAS
jgi:thiol-disulfide isomerase/thioredoxin